MKISLYFIAGQLPSQITSTQLLKADLTWNNQTAGKKRLDFCCQEESLGHLLFLFPAFISLCFHQLLLSQVLAMAVSACFTSLGPSSSSSTAPVSFSLVWAGLKWLSIEPQWWFLKAADFQRHLCFLDRDLCLLQGFRVIWFFGGILLVGSSPGGIGELLCLWQATHARFVLLGQVVRDGSAEETASAHWHIHARLGREINNVFLTTLVECNA